MRVTALAPLRFGDFEIKIRSSHRWPRFMAPFPRHSVLTLRAWPWASSRTCFKDALACFCQFVGRREVAIESAS